MGYEIDVIIDNGKQKKSDDVLFFGDSDGKLEDPVYHSKAKDMESLMMELGIYPSKSASRRAGRTGKIPEGYTDFLKVSKLKRLNILNPI